MARETTTPTPPLPRTAPPIPPPIPGAGDAGDSSARAVEVAALLGDSVVAVKHVMNPRAGRTSAPTYALLGAGALCLVLASFAFLAGVRTSATNQEALRRFTEVERRPVHEFRPHRLHPAHDWMALGGAVGGLLCLVLGLVRLRSERVEPTFRIGRAPGVDLPTDDTPGARFPLVAPRGDGFILNFTRDMDGDMAIAGSSIPLAELEGSERARPSATLPGALEAPIAPGARFRVTSGSQTFLVSSVLEPRRQAVPLLAGFDGRLLGYVGGAAVVALGFLTLVFSIPPDPKALALDGAGGEGRLASVSSKPAEEPRREPDTAPDRGEDDAAGVAGARMALDDGTMGREDSERATGRYQIEDRQVEPRLARHEAIARAREAGVLGLLRPGTAFASFTGAGDFASGIDDRDVYGGLVGSEVGEMAGWGMGFTGVGPGAGGDGWGTIGAGPYGRLGFGSGESGWGFGSRPGRGGPPDRRARPPEVTIVAPNVAGDLDPNIIRRYIRLRLGQVKACYERELLVKPHLGGTVVVEFQIRPNGTVQGTRAQGVDSGVSSCVGGVIDRIQFPRPRNAGYVNVRYPFHFRTGGA